jgi:ankyrin repeat protein
MCGIVQVNAKDAAGATPLHLAASPAAVEILLAVGASPQDTNNAGAQPAAGCVLPLECTGGCRSGARLQQCTGCTPTSEGF